MSNWGNRLSLRLAVVTALLAVGHAYDLDFGGYATGGSLNGLCFVRPNPNYEPFNSRQYTNIYTGTNNYNYFITNGKVPIQLGSAQPGANASTWVYSYYSTPFPSYNNNSIGQGSVTYPSPNQAVLAAGNAGGTFKLTGAGNTPPSPPPPNTPFPASPSAPGGAVGGALGGAAASPSGFSGRQVRGYFNSHVKPFGIQQVVFPSKTLGIAVGMGTVNPTSPIVQDFTTFPQANPQTPTGLPSSPNILISKDNGASWHQVTGVPSYARTQVQKFYDPRGPVLFPLAPQGAPDLFGVFFASKSLGWAVGGNGALASASTGVRMDATANARFGSQASTNRGLVGVVSGLFDYALSYNALGFSTLTVPAGWDAPLVQDSFAFVYGAGSILMTTNGGTVWRNVPITYSQTTLYAAYALSPALGAAMITSRQAGTLLAVASDVTGRNVWAVGCSPYQFVDDTPVPTGSGLGYDPGDWQDPLIAGPPQGGGVFGFIVAGNSAIQKTPNSYNNVPAAQNFNPTHTVNDFPYGTVMYSSNSGVSWTMQIPPTTGLLYYDYALFDVYVQSSTTVFAVGGNLNNPSATAFTDETDPYPAAGTPAVQRQPSMYIGPGFGNGIIVLSVNSGANWQQMTYPGMTYGNAPAFTCITFNNGVGWVGGYVYKPGPLLNILGQYEFLPNNDAVTATYPVNGTIAPFQTIGLSYTVLITLDQRTWTPAPSASFPPGFIEQGTAGTPQVYNARVQAQQDVMGIEWDNSLNGWMYGTGSEDKSGFILSTRDGGNTWRYETPQDVLANGLDVHTCANVPISH